MSEDNDLNGKIRRIAISFGFFFLIASVITYAFFSVSSEKFENKIFWIEHGESLDTISKNLKKEGIIRSAALFEEIIQWQKKDKGIKTGKYVFEKPVNVFKVSRIILGGPRIELVKITIPEGWSNEKIGEYFEEKNFFSFSQNEWLAVASSFEGYLFPDTYFIDKDSQAEQVVKIMRENFETKITAEMKKDMEKNSKNFYEILIMASLIEKEAFDSLEEKKMISGILWKRLKKNMPLQVDATVSYLVGKPSLKLTEADLAVDSPFNTYKYRGLPPAPIGNPGLESITSAIYPKDSPYWYYLHDSRGKIHYAKTFDEHKVNKARYLQ